MTIVKSILAAAIVALPASAVLAADPIDQRHYIYMEASASVEVDADLTYVSISLSEKRNTAEAATKIVSDKISTLRASLANLGLKDSRVETRKFDFSKVYIIAKDKTGKPIDYSVNPDRDKFDGYRATYTATITLHTTENVGAVLSSASLLGIEVDSVTFGSSHAAEYDFKAQQMAGDDARKKAEIFARSLGGTLGDLLNVKEGTGYNPDTMEYPTNDGEESADLALLDPVTVPMDIAPGKLSFSASVSAKWELAPAKS